MTNITSGAKQATLTRQATLKGIGCMVLGGFFLTVNDAIQKWMTGDFPRGELLAVRGMFVMIPILLLAWRMGGLSTLRIHSGRGQAARAVLVCMTSFLFITALSLMPLADAIALTFVSPLILTGLAAMALGESVGWRRWMAVAVGFLGVIVMLRPGTGVVQWAAVFPLGVAFLGAVRDVVTRRMHDTESTIAIMFYSFLAVIVVYSTTAFYGWKPISGPQLALFAANGLVLGLAHFFLIEALRLTGASVIAPYKYVTMIWALVFGFVLWGDLPDSWMIVGGALVVGSGLYILRRETILKQNVP
jgi:drug/metabolite transporter (DMT)-like permease